jgi:hypothetical protein
VQISWTPTYHINVPAARRAGLGRIGSRIATIRNMFRFSDPDLDRAPVSKLAVMIVIPIL